MGSVSRFRIIFLLLSLPAFIAAQAGSPSTLHKALLDISKQHKLSLIFNPAYIQDREVALPLSTLSADRQIAAVLKNTGVTYEVKNGQIFLFKQSTVYGYIEDAETGERLIASSVYIKQNEAYALSNEYGYFSISTRLDSIDLEVSYLGYASKTLSLNLHNISGPQTIRLATNNNLQTVEITDALVSDDERKYIELNKGSDVLLLQNQANSAIGGEPDIFQAMIRQTGVNAGADGIGGIHIRGGKNDQNMVLLDGVRIYNPAHAFGVYSIVNSSVIDRATLHKSGSNGANTGRLSSVMDIKTKDPDLQHIQLSGQLTSLASQATVSVPVVKGKLGIMATGRRTHINSVLTSLSDVAESDEFTNEEVNYSFSDIGIKSYAKLSDRSRLYLSLYRATDRYADNTVYDDGAAFELPLIFEDYLDYGWQSDLASLRFNTILSKHTFLNVQTSYYEYTYESEVNYTDKSFDAVGNRTYEKDYRLFNSGISNLNLRLNFETIKSKQHLQYGVSASSKIFRVGNLIESDTEYDNTEPIPEDLPLYESTSGRYLSRELTVHLSDKIKFSKHWLTDAAIYLTYTDAKDVDYENILDRHTLMHGYLLSQFALPSGYSMGFSISRNVQTEHLLTTADNGYPNDIWVPSTQFTPPATSNQIELFASKKIANHTLRVGTYFKQQKGLIFYNPVSSLPSLTDFVTFDWESETVLGNAEGWGVEVDYTYHKPKQFTVRAAYTYGNMNYQFDMINDGQPFPFDYAIPHTVSLGSSIHLHEKWLMNIDWYFSSGRPFTLFETDVLFSPLERDLEGSLIALDGFNDKVAPSVHKLSVSVATHWHWGKVRNDLSVGIQNVYNRRNEIYRYEYFDIEDGTSETLRQNGFPLLPIFKWKATW